MRHSRNNNYQLSCLKHFTISHPQVDGMNEVDMEGVGNHPNSWFIASRQYHIAKSSSSSSNQPSSSSSSSKRSFDTMTPLPDDGIRPDQQDMAQEQQQQEKQQEEDEMKMEQQIEEEIKLQEEEA